MYKLIRPLLFLFSAETAHKLTIAILKLFSHVPLFNTIMRWCFSVKTPTLERNLFGITFKNPIGIAGGFDKNGECYNQIANFGFSFIEIGSVTPKPQDGNAKPRCFRLKKDKAIINRMGINNVGVHKVVENIKNNPPRIIIAGNLSKNSDTSNEDAPRDFEKSFSILYDFVDFFILNVSCPNVKDLQKLQDTSTLSSVIDHLLALRIYYDDYKPIMLKVSPDLDKEQLDEIIELVLISGLDGIVAANTTKTRPDTLKTSPTTIQSIGDGGLSGAPLFEKTLDLVKYISSKTEGLVPIIASGGIMSAKQAKDLLDAGASLIEVYTGFIYNGPSFAKMILKYLKKC